MNEVDIGELNSLDDLAKYPKGTEFVLKDDKVILPPAEESKIDTTSQ